MAQDFASNSDADGVVPSLVMGIKPVLAISEVVPLIVISYIVGEISRKTTICHDECYY